MGYSDKFNVSDTPCADQTPGYGPSCHGLACHHGTCFGESRPIDQYWRDCSCDAGWKGWKCDQCCMLPCVNGYCEVDSKSNMHFCDCDTSPNRYTGPLCEELVPNATIATIVVDNPVSWNTTTITATALLGTLLVLLLLLSALLPYILYKKRHLLALRLIYWFKDYEDDDQRKFDVFISYRTSDDKNRHFVLQRLLKKIENDWGFKACIDVRDFMIGNDIAENIKMAVMESRRTILFISPEYIQGMWPHFEVQSALMETLRQPHQIIPIIYEPLDSCKEDISVSLTHILESITYIEWPHCEDAKEQEKHEDEFWRRLKLSLPKLRRLEPVIEQTSDSPQPTALTTPGVSANPVDVPDVSLDIGSSDQSSGKGRKNLTCCWPHTENLKKGAPPHTVDVTRAPGGLLVPAERGELVITPDECFVPDSYYNNPTLMPYGDKNDNSTLAPHVDKNKMAAFSKRLILSLPELPLKLPSVKKSTMMERPKHDPQEYFTDI